MFWGLILEPNKRYTQMVDKPFHISQAALDTSTGDNEVCQVMVIVDKKNYLICTLQKGKAIQLPLDLYFKTGETVSFLTNGKCNIHMTGYLDPEFEDEPEDDEDEDDEGVVPELVQAGKKRALEVNNTSANKKIKLDTKKAKSNKPSKEDSDEESGDDDLKRLLDGEISDDENDDSFNVNSSAGAESDDEEEDDEDEEDDSEEGEEEEEDESEEEKVEKVAPPPPAEAKLSKNQKRKLKKLQKQQELQKPVNGVEKKEKQEKSKDVQEAKSPSTDKKTLSGGVMVEDLLVGSGPIAKPGKVVQVYYEGKLKQNNKKFDSCQKGSGFKFRLGSKEVISGWDVGVAGMKVGGKRKIVCPPAMAYGAKGSPPVIPPNSTLVFEVELKNVK